MFQWSAIIARLWEVKNVSMDMLTFPTVLHNVGGATVISKILLLYQVLEKFISVFLSIEPYGHAVVLSTI